jgi:hypothetical protein
MSAYVKIPPPPLPQGIMLMRQERAAGAVPTTHHDLKEMNNMAFEDIKKGMGDIPGEIGSAGLQKALEGIQYPASKQKLVDTARGHNAPDSVMNKLQKMPDKQYESPTDVTRTFSETR